MIMTTDSAECKVAIQGYEGSFHQQAAIDFFGEKVSVLPCDTFRQVIDAASHDKGITAGIMAIENSIAGSILSNYTLLQKSKLKVVGEVYLTVKQQLLVNPGVALEDIREVHSHPMALLQCMDFLEKYPHWKLVETEDTALSARHIHQRRSRYQAAIAGKLAAGLYGLDIAASNVHTIQNNYTRFLILKRLKDAGSIDNADKATIRFQTDHTKGSLARVLNYIADCDINLSKIQSMPIPGTKFRYAFHADLEFANPAQYAQLIEGLKPITEGMEEYGVYKCDEKGKP